MTGAEQLRAIDGEARKACALLETPTPEALDDCSTVLAAAAGALRALEPGLRGLARDPQTLAEARGLQRTVRRAAALLAEAHAYHRRWHELLGVRTAGYGPGGQPGASPPPGRLCLKG
jgi:hypothetical protein